MADLKEKTELTAQDEINRLRLAAHPSGKKGLWLKDLSDRRLAEVYHRLKMGQPLLKIAKMVQVDWGVLRKSDIKTVARGLRKFRERVLTDIREGRVSGEITEREEKSLTSKAKRIASSIDGLGTLRWLIDIQAERVEDLRQKEKKSMPFKFTGKEVERLGNLIEQYFQVGMRIGAIDEKPHELNVNVKTGFDSMLKKLPDDGSRLLTMTTRFLEAADKLSIKMEKAEDGSYVPVREESDAGDS